MKHRFFLAEDALSAFGAATTRERALLTDYFQHIASFPEHCDREWSLGGFDFYAKRFGRWTITNRVDGAVKHAFILAIDKLALR